MVEGTPLLRAHLGKTWIEGSNPSFSASNNGKTSLRLDENPAEPRALWGFSFLPVDHAPPHILNSSFLQAVFLETC